MGFRNGDAHETQLTHAPDSLAREARLAVDGRGNRAHLFVGEVARHRLDHLLLLGELDVHGVAFHFSRSFLNSAARSGATSNRSPTIP